MKTIVTGILSLLLLFSILSAQDFDIRVIQDDFDYIAVQMRETSGTGLPATTSDIMDVQFEIRWDTTFIPLLDVGIICSDYFLVDGLGSKESAGKYFYRVFAADSVPFHPQADWEVDEWVTIGQFHASDPYYRDTATFSAAEEDWVIYGLNINIDGVDYSITLGDSLQNYPYPTLIYDYVWKGGATAPALYDEHSWTYGLNWENECGQRYDTTGFPSYSNMCIIPGGLAYYPTNFNNSTDCSARILKLNADSYLEIPSGKKLWISTDLTVDPEAGINVLDGGELHVEQPD